MTMTITVGDRKTEESILSPSPVPVPVKPVKHKKIRKPSPDRRAAPSQASLATSAPVYEGEFYSLDSANLKSSP